MLKAAHHWWMPLLWSADSECAGGGPEANVGHSRRNNLLPELPVLLCTLCILRSLKRQDRVIIGTA